LPAIWATVVQVTMRGKKKLRSGIGGINQKISRKGASLLSRGFFCSPLSLRGSYSIEYEGVQCVLRFRSAVLKFFSFSALSEFPKKTFPKYWERPKILGRMPGKSRHYRWCPFLPNPLQDCISLGFPENKYFWHPILL
jgi:hypothetical protein